MPEALELLCCHCFALVAGKDWQATLGIHEDACHGIGLTGDNVGIDDLVGDGRLGIGNDVLVVIDGVEGVGADLGRADHDGLVLVVHIGVHSDGLALVRKGLECNERRLIGYA